MSDKKAWIKFRHKVSVAVVRPFFSLIAKYKYHAKVDKFKGEGKRNWLILSNHQTDFDQFFLGLSFKQPLYYVAMEDLFSNGFLSRVIEWLVAPIPFLKASTDIKAIKSCFRVAREGGNIALFPEGNRTYSGKTCYIKLGVAAIAKKLNLPIAIYRIEGGYGVKPRWADSCRKGSMRAGVRRVIEPEEYKDMSKEELYSVICKELWVDESVTKENYYSKHLAEGLERTLYICPDCGITEFETHKDIISCKQCGKKYRYLPNKRFEALKGKCRFKSVADWYDYQEEFIKNIDLSRYINSSIFSDIADLLEIIVYKNKKPIAKKALITAFADRLEIKKDDDVIKMNFDDVRAMACVAGHKLNIFHENKVYQIRGGKSFNALKYCNIYYHTKFIKGEHSDGEFQFLGL